MPSSWYVQDELPRFKNPPVVETAMGIEFPAIPGLGFVNLTRLQNRWAEQFPILTEQPALSAVTMMVGNGVPPTRLWAEGEDHVLLVQTQADRLILNWRKQPSELTYPGYESLRPVFETLWKAFLEFVAEENLGEVVPRSAEYTYVNNVMLNSGEAVEDVLTVLSRPNGEVPGKPMSTQFQIARVIEKSEEHGDPYDAQILVIGAPQVTEQGPVLAMNVAATVLFATGGVPMDALDKAHALASHTFAGLTTSDKQDEWGRV